jgi:hypothetical protein
MKGSESTGTGPNEPRIRHASPTKQQEIEKSAQKPVPDRQQCQPPFLLTLGGTDDDLQVVSLMIDDGASFHPLLNFI